MGGKGQVRESRYASRALEGPGIDVGARKGHDWIPMKGGGGMTSSELARRFVDRINAHDVEGLITLMTSNHTFIDSLGAQFTRPGIENGWRRYFEQVPDYWVKIDRAFSRGDIAILIGKAGGTYVSEGGVTRTENAWETPAVWVARIEGQKVAEWRIYSDNEPIRDKMRRSRGPAKSPEAS